MIDPLASGFIGALLSTLPIGPINLVLIGYAWRKMLGHWWFCLIGILAGDALLSLLAMGASEWLQLNVWDGPLFKAIAMMLSALIILYVMRQLWSSDATASLGNDHSRKAQEAGHPLLSGIWAFGMTVIEPGLFPFWVVWWASSGIEAHLHWQHMAAATSGLVVGDLTVFFFYRWLASGVQNRVSVRTMNLIMKAACMLMAVAALALFTSGLRMLTFVDRGTLFP